MRNIYKRFIVARLEDVRGNGYGKKTVMQFNYDVDQPTFDTEEKAIEYIKTNPDNNCSYCYTIIPVYDLDNN